MQNHARPLPIGMQQSAKLRHPLFSKINANTVTCRVENVPPELPNECFCVRCEPHATQLPAGSNTHYPRGIIPPSDSPLAVFSACSACVSLSLFVFLNICVSHVLKCVCDRLVWQIGCHCAYMCMHQFTISLLTFQVLCMWCAIDVAYESVKATASDVSFVRALQEDGLYLSA